MRRVGFTLIELLVVIAIIAVLAVVVILVLNPAALLQQSRDANRLSDLSTISSAMNLFTEDVTGGSLGSATAAYISVSDPSATSTVGDQCQGLGLPAFSASTTWQCAASSSARSISGTGWIPANLSLISAGSPLGVLPMDPINQTSSGLYYSFGTNGTTFEVAAVMESAKYRSQFSTSPAIAAYPGVAAAGSNPAVAPLFSSTGLVGYWNFEEGSGTTAIDQSGIGDNGTWGGTLGSQYAPGKVGNDAGVFDGTDNKVTIPAGTTLQGVGTAGTISAWINYSTATTSATTVFDVGGTGPVGAILFAANGGINNKPAFQYGTGGTTFLLNSTTLSLSVGTWYLLGATWNSSGANLYLNGALLKTTTTTPAIVSNSTVYIGSNGGVQRYFGGDIDDVRVYNRVLSAAEMAALYNAQK